MGSRKDNRKQYIKRKRVFQGLLGLVVLLAAAAAITVWITKIQAKPKEAEPVTSETSSSKEAKTSSTEISSTTAISQESSTTISASTSSSEAAPKEVPTELDGTQLQANAAQVQYGVYYFNEDKLISSNNSAATPSASVIKVFIMNYAYDQLAAGTLTADTLIQGQTLESWLYPMIQNSDNAATNALIDHFGMAALNSYFQAQGYGDTRLERRMLDFAAQSQGLENYTSLNDTLTFLQKLYHNQGAYPYSQMLTIMKGQQVRTKIPSQMPAGLVIANKTGELDTVENDIGIVFDPQHPFAISVLSNGIYSSGGMRQAIGQFALAAEQAVQ